MTKQNNNPEDSWKFLPVGRSKNLWRPLQSLSSTDSQQTAPLRHKSNLFRRSQFSFVEEQPESGEPSLRSRAYSAQDMANGVELLRRFIRQEQKLENEADIRIIFTILEQQSRNSGSVAGLFEMLREEDPNRARIFRVRLGKLLHQHFPDEPIGVLLTQVFSQEWKNAEKKELLASMEVTTDMKINQLLHFDRRFSKWYNFFLSLKRKLMTSVSHSSLHEFSKKKEGFSALALIHLLNGEEEFHQAFISEISILYNQILTENQLIIDIVKQTHKKDQERTFLFFKTLILGFELMDILTVQTNILKLEGAQARSICPDKKQFIYLHLSRLYEEIVSMDLPSLNPFIRFLDCVFTSSNILKCEYNRKQVNLVFQYQHERQDISIVISGHLERLSELSCQSKPEQF